MVDKPKPPTYTLPPLAVKEDGKLYKVEQAAYTIKDIMKLQDDEEPLKKIFSTQRKGFIEVQQIKKFFIEFDTAQGSLKPITVNDNSFITTTISPPDGMLNFLQGIMDNILGKKDQHILK